MLRLGVCQQASVATVKYLPWVDEAVAFLAGLQERVYVVAFALEAAYVMVGSGNALKTSMVDCAAAAPARRSTRGVVYILMKRASEKNEREGREGKRV